MSLLCRSVLSWPHMRLPSARTGRAERRLGKGVHVNMDYGAIWPSKKIVPSSLSAGIYTVTFKRKHSEVA
jgi:hypothetical protein